LDETITQLCTIMPPVEAALFPLSQRQKRRFDNRPVISGLPPTSDMSLHPTK
jgi:hypothetical protein